MKKPVWTVILAMAASAAMAQGTLLFGNYIPAAGINAPVWFGGGQRPGAPIGGPGPATGPAFLAQYLAGPAGNLAPVGTPVAFRSGAEAGYVPTSSVTVPTVPGGSVAQVVFVAWAADYGATYAEAFTKGCGGTGASAPFTVTLTSSPAPPADPLGIQGFTIAPCIPEPSVLAFGALGAGWLMLHSRKGRLAGGSVLESEQISPETH